MIVRELKLLKCYANKREFEDIKYKRGQLQLDSEHDVLLVPLS